MRTAVALLVMALATAGFSSAATVSCTSPSAHSDSNIEYFVSVSDHERHVLHVAIRYRSQAAMIFQMPAWNALYQVRDFSQYVTNLRAENSKGEPLAVTVLDKDTWQVAASNGCAVLQYDDFANTPSPFSAQANSDHVFLNWAQVLPYAPSERQQNVMLAVTDVPAQWALHDLGLFDEKGRSGTFHLSRPVLYDALVDSPVEIGKIQISTFDQDGARFRIVVDADSGDYNLHELQDAIKKVVHAEIDWMGDRPFEQYTFLFHFPHGPIGGGMEHSFGTAVTTPASRVKENAIAPIDTSAHEFFHLWNVKRIRPQSMEPVDFEHEQYTRALWFCEGVTSTVSEIMLVRAGLLNEKGYLQHLSEVISDFEGRPAHRFQSPEASSLEAWMEGRAYYRQPQRSVSYYTSGELVGVLLDLRVRALTHGSKSLRDVFQWMNAQYAKRSRFYDDSKGVEEAAEKITGTSLAEFFRKYVSSTDAIPYDDFFTLVGLKLETFTILGADPGFDASVNFSGSPEVDSIAPGSEVAAAGVRVGDKLTAINGEEYPGDLDSFMVGHKPGETIAFRFTSRGHVINVNVTLKPLNTPAYALVDLPKVTAEQLAQRNAWIKGDDLPPGAE